ncbi:hypothetical protein [Streptomyces canus]|uniref:hypothetical protein n=1 Tax=Streptomyces canus TaxID=58343 RepID=UPI00224D0D85|nr:hypothetical protein [Streptomyces canus]
MLDPPDRFADLAPVDEDIGLVVAPRGRLPSALTVTVDGGRITSYDVAAAGRAVVLGPPGRFSSPSATR